MRLHNFSGENFEHFYEFYARRITMFTFLTSMIRYRLYPHKTLFTRPEGLYKIGGNIFRRVRFLMYEILFGT